MNAKSGNRGSWTVAAMVAAALVLAASAAAAEAPTREAYVAQLERICKPDAEATQRAMKGARADIQADRLAAATPKFARATAIFSGTVREIAAVSRPPDDLAKLSKWFGYLKAQESYLRQITQQLRADHAIKAQRLISRFIHQGNLANYEVLAFEFNYCSFKFSRYG